MSEDELLQWLLNDIRANGGTEERDWKGLSRLLDRQHQEDLAYVAAAIATHSPLPHKALHLPHRQVDDLLAMLSVRHAALETLADREEARRVRQKRKYASQLLYPGQTVCRYFVPQRYAGVSLRKAQMV